MRALDRKWTWKRKAKQNNQPGLPWAAGMFAGNNVNVYSSDHSAEEGKIRRQQMSDSKASTPDASPQYIVI